MPVELLSVLTAGVLVIAVLYSCVGHAGASGYIAVMTLCGLAPAEIKPLALTLNVLVSAIATWHFWRAGYFSWRAFWPFAAPAMPCAYLGGYLNLPADWFKALVGCVLLFSAAQFLLRPPPEREPRLPSRPVAIGVGAGLGLLSGLTGTGGGIFLTPLLILMGWARTTTAAAVSAPFILLNSSAGLLGNLSASGAYPRIAPALIVAAGVGGLIGSRLGSRRLAPMSIKRVLAVVLIVAGLKLVLT